MQEIKGRTNHPSCLVVLLCCLMSPQFAFAHQLLAAVCLKKRNKTSGWVSLGSCPCYCSVLFTDEPSPSLTCRLSLENALEFIDERAFLLSDVSLVACASPTDMV